MKYELPKCLYSISAGVLFEGVFSLWVFIKLILLLQLETISIWIWHVLCEQFCCSCMYTKTARKRLQLFKETTWVVKLLRCWSSCNFNDIQNYLIQIYVLAFSTFPRESSFGKTSGPTKKANVRDNLLCVLHYVGRSWYISRKNQVGCDGCDGIMNYTL